MSILSTFAKLVGVPERLAEDALHSERASRHTLSRRGVMGALAAMAAGSAFGFPAPPEWDGHSVTLVNGVAYSWESVKLYVGQTWLADLKFVSINYNGPARDIGCHITEAIRVAGSERGA